MVMASPLPVRRGVNATRLRVPETGPWQSVHDYLQHRFGHVDSAGITQRFLTGEVVDHTGRALDLATPLGEVEFLWYYREVPDEQPLPVTESILYEDEHLLVADKPHFLPTTPAGRFVQQSLLVRLRRRRNLPQLVPIHRLDRGTAGVVLFAKNPETRGAYQLLFERRQVSKTYECVSALPRHSSPADLATRMPLTVRSRIHKTKGVVISQRMPYEVKDSGRRLEEEERRRRKRHDTVAGANASSRVELLGFTEPSVTKPDVTKPGTSTAESAPALGHFRLHPHTGKTHQLRLHMAMIGLGIRNDRFYPELLDDAPDDFNAPLQLLARSISFTDPLSGQPRRFDSARRLDEAPS